jgi:hypothetical protein
MCVGAEALTRPNPSFGNSFCHGLEGLVRDSHEVAYLHLSQHHMRAAANPLDQFKLDTYGTEGFCIKCGAVLPGSESAQTNSSAKSDIDPDPPDARPW